MTFHSRFILGSGKYSLKLIEAAVQRRGGGDHYPGGAPGKHQGAGEYSGLYSRGSDPAAQHQRSQKRRGGGADRAAGQRAGVRRFRKDRDHAGFQISAAGQPGDDPCHGDSGEGRVCGYALHVPGSECGQGSGQRGGGYGYAAGGAHRLQQGSGYQGVYPDSHR